MSSSHPYTAVDDEDDTDICPVCDSQCTCRLQTHPASPIPSLKIKLTIPPSLIVKRQQPTSLKKRGRPTNATPPVKLNKVSQNLKARPAAISKKVVKHRRVPDDRDSSDTQSSTVYNHDRLRRELLPTDLQLKKRSPTTHNWVIRPRKKSVAGSDAEQVDVDAENKIDQEDEDDEDKLDPDGIHHMQEDEDTDARHHYVGLATGWSDEDESSFDADLFFANLSSSSSSSTNISPTHRRCHSYAPGGVGADQLSSASESPLRAALPFEVTDSWDGQLIFTNGEPESRGIVDIDFEKDAEGFIIDSDADDDHDDDFSPYRDHPIRHPSSTAQAPESSDIDMSSISDADAGYEEDGGEADEGDTTDEELVDDDCFPNERAMRLFTLPMPHSTGMSAINPMSTVSSSIGFEKSRHPRRMDVDGNHDNRKSWRRRLKLGAGAGPRAAEILTGKFVFDGHLSSSSDLMVKTSEDKGKQKAASSPSFSPTLHTNYPRQIQTPPCTPRTGLFVPTGQTRQAVIGEDKKGVDVPSPHPRFYGRKRRVNVVQYLLEKHLLSQSQSSPVAPSASTTSTKSGSSPSIISDVPSPFHHLLSSSAASPITGAEDGDGGEYDIDASTPCPCPAEREVDDITCIVELDDVLEASFLDDSMDRESAPSLVSVGTTSLEHSSTTPTTATSLADSAVAEVSNKHLTRWDVISIGAFRQTREQQQQQAWGPGSRSSAVADYGGALKTGASAAGSPLSALLWQNNTAGSSVGIGAGSSKKTKTSSSSVPTFKSTPRTSRGSAKTAKRRKLMMASSS